MRQTFDKRIALLLLLSLSPATLGGVHENQRRYQYPNQSFCSNSLLKAHKILTLTQRHCDGSPP
jgi:hypothetical protein